MKDIAGKHSSSRRSSAEFSGHYDEEKGGYPGPDMADIKKTPSIRVDMCPADTDLSTLENADPSGLAGLSHIPTHRSAVIEFPPETFQGAPQPPRKKEGAAADDDVLSSPDDVYNRFPRHRKIIISLLLSLCGFLSPISGASILAAIPEVAASYGTSGSIIGVSNAMYLIFMGLSPCFWGPLSQVFGRRFVAVTTSTIFTIASIGTAFSPNIGSFFFFRMMTAFASTAFQVLGPAVIGDIYHPTERARGLAWFMPGPLIGPCVGPFLGGVLVALSTWRSIFYLQSAVAGCAALGTYFLLPETLVILKKKELEGLPTKQKIRVLWSLTNPLRVVRLLLVPNHLLNALAAGTIVFTHYGMLTPVRYVINPRFGLTSPIQSGLVYIAPGAGFLSGVWGGPRFADWMMARWMRKRGGVRVPEDRLQAPLPFLGIALPVCLLVYGWSLEANVGGITVPLVFMYLQGVAQMFCYPAVDTYCIDVNQERGAEVIGANYMARFFLGAIASAVVLPATESIGVGVFSTINAALLFGGACAIASVWKYGHQWRTRIDERKRERREGRQMAAAATTNTTTTVMSKKKEKKVFSSVVEDGATPATLASPAPPVTVVFCDPAATGTGTAIPASAPAAAAA